jgi:hypothetical protein
MANLLERTIDCDDGDEAAKMIRQCSASNPTKLLTTYFLKLGQRIGSNAFALSGNGSRQSLVFWSLRPLSLNDISGASLPSAMGY